MTSAGRRFRIYSSGAVRDEEIACLLPAGLCRLAGAAAARGHRAARSPFFIKKTWIIGGVGNWDYLTMDAAAQRLYIAHAPRCRWWNVETGQVAG